MNKIGILDYGVGNVRSIQNMLWRIDINSTVVRKSSELLQMNKLILPGVGAFDVAIKELSNMKLMDDLESFADDGYILGICLGMQMLAKKSEEGERDGLGLIDGIVKKFDSTKLVVPHIGWNYTQFNQDSIFYKETINQRFYFVHSYYFQCNNLDNSIGTTSYGSEFTSVVTNEDENVFGCQFHPEKSHSYGKSFLKKFCEL